MSAHPDLLIENDRLRAALEVIRRWPAHAAGVAECTLTGQHKPEWHDYGGGWYCARCMLGCGTNPGECPPP